MTANCDVVVVGSGNAGFSAAHSAREEVDQVCVVEKAPAAWFGGNSYFTMGSFRTTYDGLDDLRPILASTSDGELADLELPPYTRDDFWRDMHRLTEGLCDPELTEMLIDDSRDRVNWLASKGIKWALQTEHQTYVVEGKRKFWGGGTLCTVDGGKGLIDQHLAQARSREIDVRTDSKVIDLLRRGDRVAGVVCSTPDGVIEVEANAVVLAAGGFEANPQWRAQYLGPNWDVAKVRGTRYNTGEVIALALQHGATPYGNWSGAHAVSWDAGAAQYGDRDATNKLSRHSYPHGIVVNRDGERFIDEGADFRNYTYAKYGREVLRQPGGIAFQIFDAESARLIRMSDYETASTTRYEADSLEELAKLTGINVENLTKTVSSFNAAVQPGTFNAAIRDGKRTVGITPSKSNWALPVEKPPFVAFRTTCAITFTYGGVRIDRHAHVLGENDEPIEGLHAAGEMVGGLFFHNYPGGSGLMAGTVFGYRAGKSAAACAI